MLESPHGQRAPLPSVIRPYAAAAARTRGVRATRRRARRGADARRDTGKDGDTDSHGDRRLAGGGRKHNRDAAGRNTGRHAHCYQRQR